MDEELSKIAKMKRSELLQLIMKENVYLIWDKIER
jgi:hypothetical protein